MHKVNNTFQVEAVKLFIQKKNLAWCATISREAKIYNKIYLRSNNVLKAIGHVDGMGSVSLLTPMPYATANVSIPL